MVFHDLDSDGLDDALLLDNGPNKRLLFLLLEGNGALKEGGLSELPLRGELSALAVGKFDNNDSLDLAVSGFLEEGFVQFILSPADGFSPGDLPTADDFQVTPPRRARALPDALLPVRQSDARDALLAETPNEGALDAFVPEQ